MAGTQASTTESKSDAGVGGQAPAQAHLFRVISAVQPLLPSSRHGLRDVDEVLLGRGSVDATRARRQLRVSDPDARISMTHARLQRKLGRWLVEDLGSRNGTRVNGETTQGAALNDGDVIEIGRTFFLFRDGLPTNADAPADEVATADVPLGLVTLAPALARAFRALEAVAASDVSVAIHGETGTGKELVARAVHALSRRRGPFVAVNCGAIPSTLAPSELFGVRRGAYSDAREDRAGVVRSADGGTLFLDEVADLPAAVQPAFLRVLQEREVSPVGQPRPVPVDIRVVSASHRSLDDLARAGALREDLVGRLSGFSIRLPPLRARREDLGILVATLIRRLSTSPDSVTFHPEAVRLLLGHDWPRNVRQLETQLQAALALARGARLGPAHFPELAAALPAAPAPEPGPRDAALRAELSQLLTQHQGNLTAVARALGKDRVQLRRWLRRLSLDAAQFRR